MELLLIQFQGNPGQQKIHWQSRPTKNPLAILANKKSIGILSMQWKRLPQRLLPLSFELPNAYSVPDRKDRVSFI
jgi:hypothetical protein